MEKKLKIYVNTYRPSQVVLVVKNLQAGEHM